MFYRHIVSKVQASLAAEKCFGTPFKLPAGSKAKYGVYVKNSKGKAKKVIFNGPTKDMAACMDKTKAAYWSGKMDSSCSSVEVVGKNSFALSLSDCGFKESDMVSEAEMLAKYPDMKDCPECCDAEDEGGDTPENEPNEEKSGQPEEDVSKSKCKK